MKRKKNNFTDDYTNNCISLRYYKNEIFIIEADYLSKECEADLQKIVQTVKLKELK